MSDTKEPTTTTTTIASANWLALKKTLVSPNPRPHKRRKLDHAKALRTASPSRPSISATGNTNTSTSTSSPPHFNTTLQRMITGPLTHSPSQTQPGKYLAIDCEMVGVGLNNGADESSLARVSLVNWHGAVLLDVFVRQRERVVDYRTRWSGVRESDMVGARPFEEAQKQVADLLKDRILIGHAVHNDLKALLLSHPHTQTRDTQIYARKHGLTKSKYIALRTLVKEQLGVSIQEGEHSSVTDARATMAVYRLHKKEWEKGMPTTTTATTTTTKLPPSELPPISTSATTPTATDSKKRKAVKNQHEGEDEDNPSSTSTTQQRRPHARTTPQRKGVSTGLSTVIKRKTSLSSDGTTTIMRGKKMKNPAPTRGGAGEEGSGKKAWWAELPLPTSSGGKGRVTAKKGSARLGTGG